MIVDRLLAGLAYGVEPSSLLVILSGVLIGFIVGAAPGIGSTVGMSVALPFALTLSPESAVLVLVSIFISATYSNSVPAVLLRVPGTASAMLTAVEGYPMHQRGDGGRAMLISLVASVSGQVFGIVVFILFVVPLSQVGVRLLFPELFVIVLFGLFAAAGLVSQNPVKGVVAIAIGLLLAVIGTDPVTGTGRLTFGIPELRPGLAVIPVIVGLLAFREVFASAEHYARSWHTDSKLRVGWLSKSDRREIALPTVVGAGVGTFIGAVPGAGGSIASFITYQFTRSFSRKKEEFGKGSPAGLAGVESSNNAAVAGELIPTFGLGIPGAPPMVVVMAALSAQGLIPGPRLFETRPQLLYATFGGLLIASLMLAIVGYLMIKPSVWLARLSPAATLTVTSALIVVGVYSLRWSVFDVWVSLAMGAMGYLLSRFGYSVAPIALAFILGAILESSLRRGLIMTGGWEGFVLRPVVLVGLVLALALIVGPTIWRRLRSDRRSHVPGKPA